AFTVGTDVHFGTGQYAPGTREGDRVIAHELTHTIQAEQSGVQRKSNPYHGSGDYDDESEVSRPDDPAELEADEIADQATQNLHADHGSGHRRPQPKIRAQAEVHRKVFRSPSEAGPNADAGKDKQHSGGEATPGKTEQAPGSQAPAPGQQAEGAPG